ncbi:MAG: UDP-2,3-diacylglucosamine diphosphatase LpxI [Pseudomonadota bacterium]
MTGKPLGILAAGGTLPGELAKKVVKDGRDIFVVGINGVASDELREFPHAFVSIGQIGRIFSSFEKAGCRELVVIGRFDRPDLSAIKLDATAVMNAPRLRRILKGGDDAVLTGVFNFLEDKGFQVLGIHDVAPSMLAGGAEIQTRNATSDELEDITAGFSALRGMSAFDIGQALVVINGRIVAVEAAEGTDAMLQRVGELRKTGRIPRKSGNGILVKTAKHGQDLRADIPVIGTETLNNINAAGLTGLAVEEGRVIIAQAEQFSAALKTHKLAFHIEPSNGNR